VAHLDENIIVAFFSPERTDDVVARVEAHAADCEKCRSLLAEYAAIARTEQPVVTEPLVEQPVADDGNKVDLVHRLALAQATKRIGTIVSGKWEIDALLGAGGMSVVYSARHRNGRKVALKFMRPELAVERSLVERFLREGYVANKIDHPGAVAIVDDDVAEDGVPFLVMELLTGESVRARLTRGPLPVDDAIRLVSDVLDVVAIAHDRGIVHRDLKPDNLFVTESNLVKVLDFGIAKLKEGSPRDVDTRSGVTMGTVGYMPPEQARGLTSEIDARSDVWAMGATLYALLSGRSLHEAPTPNESLLLAMTTPAPPMREALPSVPRAVSSVLDRALAFDKEQRYANAREMKAALDAARRGIGEPERAPIASPARARRSRAWPIGAVAGVTILVVGGAVAVARRSMAPHAETPAGLVATAPDTAPSSAQTSSSLAAPLPPPSTSQIAVTSRSTAPRPRPASTIQPKASALPTASAVPVEPLDPLGPRR